MSGSSNFDSFHDRLLVAVQLLLCGVLPPGPVQYCSQHSCEVAVKKSSLNIYGQIKWVTLCVYVCVFVYFCVYIHTHTHTHIYIYIYIYLCACVWVRSFSSSRFHKISLFSYFLFIKSTSHEFCDTHTHTHKYIYIYIYIYDDVNKYK